MGLPGSDLQTAAALETRARSRKRQPSWDLNKGHFFLLLMGGVAELLNFT